MTQAHVTVMALIVAMPAATAACVDVALPEGETIRGPTAERVHAFLEMKTGEGFSGAVLLAKRGKIMLKHGYGLSDRARKIANSSETLFHVASIAKTFTAAAILQLEAQGRLGLDDRLDKFLGTFPEAKAAATIHHLLTHTAGLVARGADLDYNSRVGFVASVKEAPIESAPGAAYRYTNAGYTMLAAVVEEVTGMPFESYLEQSIFKPACMSRTAFAWDGRLDNQPMAVGYAGDNIEALTATPRAQDVWGDRGPSGVATTIGDLYQWIRAIRGGGVLSRASTDKMFTAYVGDEGYGWHVIDTRYGRLVRRGGGLPDFESSLRWYIDRDVVIIAVFNNRLRLRLPVVIGIEDIVFADEETVESSIINTEEMHD